ncbi:MAG: DUF2341 domain-containing protein, partial [Candidatus Aenigmatarchaeota archaeon]
FVLQVYFLGGHRIIFASTPTPNPPNVVDSPDPQYGGGIITFSCSGCSSGGAGEYMKLLICMSNNNSCVLNSQWQYRRPITINNTLNSNTLTDYQVLVTLDTQALISAGKMRSDCGDIRFTDSDGITLLNYWLESGCNSANTKIWVKIPSIPANSNKTIYLYYGNPYATSTSNGDDTFIFFDDFEINRGWIYSENGTAWNGNYTTKDKYEGNYSYLISYPSNTPSLPGYYGRISKSINIPLEQIKVEVRVKDSYTGSTSEYHFKQIYLGDNLLWEDDVAGNEGWLYVSVNITPNTGIENLILQVYDKKGVSNFGIETYWDIVKLRKYTSPEPTISIGNEEKNIVPLLLFSVNFTFRNYTVIFEANSLSKEAVLVIPNSLNKTLKERDNFSLGGYNFTLSYVGDSFVSIAFRKSYQFLDFGNGKNIEIIDGDEKKIFLYKEFNNKKIPLATINNSRVGWIADFERNNNTTDDLKLALLSLIFTVANKKFSYGVLSKNPVSVPYIDIEKYDLFEVYLVNFGFNLPY